MLSSLREAAVHRVEELVEATSVERFLCNEREKDYFSIEVASDEGQWSVASVGSPNLTEGIRLGRLKAESEEEVREVFVPALNARFLRFRSAGGSSRILALTPIVGVEMPPRGDRILQEEKVVNSLMRAVQTLTFLPDSPPAPPPPN